MEVKDLTILILAAYGAGLSTYVAVVQRRDKRPRVEAKLAYGFLTHGSNLSDEQLLLTAANVGEKSVMLSSGGVLFPDGTQAISFGNNATERFPHELDVGKSMTMWFELKPLASQLHARGLGGKIKIRAKFTDQTSREFISKPVELDVSQWAA